MSKIEWTEQTWNPIVGCSIVSPGCTNCYAMKMADRLQAMSATQFPHYQGTTKRVNGNPVWTGKMALAPDATLTAPLRRKKPTMYFVNSMSDLFHESVPDEWIDRVFAVMALAPQHVFQVLTKRSALMRDYCSQPDHLGRLADTILTMRTDTRAVGPLPHLGGGERWWPLPNVWLGVSAERQQEADARIPDLLATPAAVRFVSAEPLLGPIDFASLQDGPAAGTINALTGDARSGRGEMFPVAPWPSIDWIIVGGESGTNARPMHPDWARGIRDQCTAAGVAFFFKQWGEWMPAVTPRNVYNRTTRDFETLPIGTPIRIGKSRAGRLLDGRTWDEYPSTSTVTPAAAEEAAA